MPGQKKKPRMYPEVHTEPELCLTMAVDQNGRSYGIEYTSYDFSPQCSKPVLRPPPPVKSSYESLCPLRFTSQAFDIIFVFVGCPLWGSSLELT